eukprot:m.156629 g.156629  ORF g.156629 m.156629 type:complete len:58 (-) comp16443_c0_seq2:60-233(-)
MGTPCAWLMKFNFGFTTVSSRLLAHVERYGQASLRKTLAGLPAAFKPAVQQWQQLAG